MGRLVLCLGRHMFSKKNGISPLEPMQLIIHYLSMPISGHGPLTTDFKHLRCMSSCSKPKTPCTVQHIHTIILTIGQSMPGSVILAVHLHLRLEPLVSWRHCCRRFFVIVPAILILIGLTLLGTWLRSTYWPSRSPLGAFGGFQCLLGRC